jgi:putative transposase
MTQYRRDSTAGGTWFFTVNLAERRSALLVDEIDTLRAAFRSVRTRHPFDVNAIVILPDHIHAIWTLPEGDADFALRWRLIKTTFSRAQPAFERRSESRKSRHERGIWRRRYWEHRIRDSRDMSAHVDYIHINPLKHGHVIRVRDWPWSSFHRHVREGLLPCDWGDTPDFCSDSSRGFGERE